MKTSLHWPMWTSSAETVTTVATKATQKLSVCQSIPRNAMEPAESSATSATRWVTKIVTAEESIEKNNWIGIKTRLSVTRAMRPLEQLKSWSRLLKE